MHGRCTGTNRDGKPCSAQVWRDGLCRWHHPDLASERDEWRRKGGAGRSNLNRADKRLPRSHRDVRDTLLRALSAVEGGELEPPKAQAMASLARAFVTVAESGELDERLAALEAAAGLEDTRTP